MKLRGDRPPERIAEALVLLASGVGNNPDSVPLVRGESGASRNAVPPQIEPERGQLSENGSKSPNKESCDVFQDNELRSNLANEPGEFKEKAGPFSIQTGAVTGEADVLAGEAAADESSSDPVGLESLSGEGFDVVIDRNSGPVMGQQVAADGFLLAEGHGDHARGLEPNGEAADAAERVDDGEGHGRPPTAWTTVTRRSVICGLADESAAWNGKLPPLDGLTSG